MNNVINVMQNFSDVKIVWADIETTGLDGRVEDGTFGMESHSILELAIHVTDVNLNILDGEGFRVVIRHNEETIRNMDEWCIEKHTESGLIAEVRESNISLVNAELLVLEHLRKHDALPYEIKEKTGSIMAGNSIKLDRNFMMAQMPQLHKYFHYRQMDVSAVNLFSRYWRPEVAAAVKKEYKHLALADIRESIEEARLYKERLFRDDAVVIDGGDVLADINFLSVDLNNALQGFDFEDPRYKNDPSIQMLRSSLVNLQERAQVMSDKARIA
ncbi:oligoribonuclease [Vibrio sp. 10N.261.46.E12]|uniref:oligoribonuclease n=1 Tax=unclassified Vibrio TaxID=2614977 RepID=UPI001F538F6C|nr:MULTISPECIES: oligoribonuclease [unclassified Vibrio]